MLEQSVGEVFSQIFLSRSLKTFLGDGNLNKAAMIQEDDDGDIDVPRLGSDDRDEDLHLEIEHLVPVLIIDNTPFSS
jgi:hypothetical protein